MYILNNIYIFLFIKKINLKMQEQLNFNLNIFSYFNIT